MAKSNAECLENAAAKRKSRGEVVVSQFVARRLDQFCISRELRPPDLVLIDAPDDTGLSLSGNQV